MEKYGIVTKISRVTIVEAENVKEALIKAFEHYDPYVGSKLDIYKRSISSDDMKLEHCIELFNILLNIYDYEIDSIFYIGQYLYNSDEENAD